MTLYGLFRLFIGLQVFIVFDGSGLTRKYNPHLAWGGALQINPTHTPSGLPKPLPKITDQQEFEQNQFDSVSSVAPYQEKHNKANVYSDRTFLNYYFDL